MTNRLTFAKYFADWVKLYKDGAVRPVTLQKYKNTQKWIEKLAPTLKVKEIDKRTYQELINDYAETHEKQTVKDFNTHLKAAILDAVDEGLLGYDPTRKVVMKGKIPRKKKPKFLSKEELTKLVNALELGSEISWDWFILLVAKTGLRFSEALGLTPEDFDFDKATLKIEKAYNYKDASEISLYADTKNESSKRVITVDEVISKQFKKLIEGNDPGEPIFKKCFASSGRVFNSTINDYLKRLCVKAGIPVITIHALRHTHGSHLLHADVSIASISKRLGHANITTTQEVYLHVIRELEEKDNDKVMEMLKAM